MEFTVRAHIVGLADPLIFSLDNDEDRSNPEQDLMQARAFLSDLALGGVVYDTAGDPWALTPHTRVVALKLVHDAP